MNYLVLIPNIQTNAISATAKLTQIKHLLKMNEWLKVILQQMR